MMLENDNGRLAAAIEGGGLKNHHGPPGGDRVRDHHVMNDADDGVARC